MSELVLRFAWWYGTLQVSECDTLDEALSAAKYAEDAGEESFDHIEVADGDTVRVIRREEADKLREPERLAHEAELKAAPPMVAVVSIASGNDRAHIGWFATVAEAEQEVARLAAFLGDRVSWREISR